MTKKLIRDYKVRKLEYYQAKAGQDVPELLRLKRIQDLWDTEENNESIAA